MAQKRKKRSAKREGILVTSIVSLALFFLLIFPLGKLGVIGESLFIFLSYLFGVKAPVIIVFSMVALLIFVFNLYRFTSLRRCLIALGLLLLAGELYFAIGINEGLDSSLLLPDFFKNTVKIFSGDVSSGSGLVGTALYVACVVLFDVLGSYLIITLLALIAIFLMIPNTAYTSIAEWFKGLFVFEKKPRKPKEPKPVREKKQRVVEEEVDEPEFFNGRIDIIDVKPKTKKRPEQFFDIEEPAPKKPKEIEPIKKKTSDTYDLPDKKLLEKPATNSESSSTGNQKNAYLKGRILIQALAQHGVQATLEDTHIGPSVTKFEIIPEIGVKVNRIAALSDDIKMALAARDIRIEAPIPGYNTIGIEIPNSEMTNVSFREVFDHMPNSTGDLCLALGKDLQGKPISFYLDRMPHLLVAGATGSGKSVCINGFIISLLMRTTPEEVRLLLIDPKKVEFMAYRGLPHLITNVVTDSKIASKILEAVVRKMEKRYEIFQENHVKNISEYHQKYEKEGKDKGWPLMEFLVVIIDELADLMMVSGKDVEYFIQRITALARAAGIYLIVATQRPSTDVITGIIKANIPSRIAFAVSSGVDSRTIIDGVGAERLLGRGDMLFYPSGQSGPTRLQGVYLSDEEINNVCKHWESYERPNTDPDFDIDLSEDNESGGYSGDFDDPLYDEVKAFVQSTLKASTSAIQRRFRLGYNRAARLIDMLEENGVVGPAQGSKSRQVYHDDEDY